VDGFSPLHSDQTGYGANQPPIHMVTEALPLGLNGSREKIKFRELCYHSLQNLLNIVWFISLDYIECSSTGQP
jgi:hypothetical protein